MSAFSNIASHAVLPLGAYALDELKKAAHHADQRLLYANLAGHGDKKSVLDTLAKSFPLQAHFGHNLDALYDCVTDLKPIEGIENPGFVVILENIPDSKAFDAAQRGALLDVFREAADYFFDKKTAFRVFYSVVKKTPV
jgi:RNAse (barnase) inhibitor barstar